MLERGTLPDNMKVMAHIGQMIAVTLLTRAR